MAPTNAELLLAGGYDIVIRSIDVFISFLDMESHELRQLLLRRRTQEEGEQTQGRGESLQEAEGRIPTLHPQRPLVGGGEGALRGPAHAANGGGAGWDGTRDWRGQRGWAGGRCDDAVGVPSRRTAMALDRH